MSHSNVRTIHPPGSAMDHRTHRLGRIFAETMDRGFRGSGRIFADHFYGGNRMGGKEVGVEGPGGREALPKKYVVESSILSRKDDMRRM